MAVKICLDSTKSLGKLIVYHRKKAGLSRVALAEIAGTGKTVVYDVEKGKVAVKFDTLLKLFNALNISIELKSPLMALYEEQNDAES